MKYFDGVGHSTTTTGMGTITLGAAIDSSFFTFVEQGAADTDQVYYRIDEGGDVEIGIGTLGSTATTLSRDTVLKSRIGGTAGTTKMTLAGAAEVLCVAPAAVMAQAEAAAPATDLDLIFRHGHCRLDLVSGSLALNRKDGRYLVIGSAVETIPETAPTLDATGVTPDTLYYIYAYMSGGSMTLEASATAPALHTTGVTVKTGDSSRTLIGMARPITGPAFVDTYQRRLVVSYFNRKRALLRASISVNRSVAPASWTEVDSEIRCEFLSFEDDAVAFQFGGYGYNSVFAVTGVAIVLDGSILGGMKPQNIADTNMNFATNAATGEMSEGYHYATVYGQTNTGTLVFSYDAQVACALNAVVQV